MCTGRWVKDGLEGQLPANPAIMMVSALRKRAEEAEAALGVARFH